VKNAAACLLAALLASGCAEMTPRESSGRDMKIAFDLTDGNPQVLLAKLNTIDLTRKQIVEAGMTPRMILAFRGGASQYTQQSVAHVKPEDRADALRVASRLRELAKAPGVESLEQCNVTLGRLKLTDKGLLEPVKVVPNGWISLATYQQKGYSYIAP